MQNTRLFQDNQLIDMNGCYNIFSIFSPFADDDKYDDKYDDKWRIGIQISDNDNQEANC